MVNFAEVIFRMAYRLWFTVVIALLVLVSSCKKEDDLPPSITIEYPLDGATFQALDTIRIGISVSDNEKIESIHAWLNTLEGATASSVRTVAPNSAQYTGVMEVIMTDKYLTSGAYTLKIMATDGKNEKFAFVEIQLHAFPKVRRSIIAVSETGLMERIDSTGNVSFVASLAHDISGVCINNRHDLAQAIGNVDGQITAISLSNNSVVWTSVHPDQPPAPAFLAQTCDDADLLISGYDHIIYGHNNFGSLILNEQVGSAYRPEELMVQNGQLLVEQVQTGTTNRFMFHYNRASMAFQNQVAIPMNVEAICEFGDDRLMLFGNNDGQASVFRYDHSQNSIWEPRSLEPGSLIDAVKGNGNVYYLAQSDGIYSYTFSPNFLNQIVPGVAAAQLRFDEDRGVLLAAVGNYIAEYSISGNVLATHQLSAGVVSFDVHYTK